jgi:hypothetical protein
MKKCVLKVVKKGSKDFKTQEERWQAVRKWLMKHALFKDDLEIIPVWTGLRWVWIRVRVPRPDTLLLVNL